MEKRCLRQSVLNAERNAKLPSNLTIADQFTAENVILNEDHQGDIKPTSYLFFVHHTYSFFIRFWKLFITNHIRQKAQLSSIV